VVFREPVEVNSENSGDSELKNEVVTELSSRWSVIFPRPLGSMEFDRLLDWSKHENPAIRYFSGTAVYRQSFNWPRTSPRLWLELGGVANIAQVRVNNVDCGFAWTPPYRVEITQAIRPGKNELEISVVNTWANRLIGDARLPRAERTTWMTAPYPIADATLLPSGLLGPVNIVEQAYSQPQQRN
jgi:hypothetical protein